MIVLRAKDIDFEVTYIDLREKPDWFLAISPHGKVPVLTADGQPLFESNAIAEFLEEMTEPRLHPADPVKRARNRAWTDFTPDFASGLRAIYYAKTREDVDAGVATAAKRVTKLEEAIANERGNDGPYFNGDRLCMVDAAYAPFLQRFALVEKELHTGLLGDFPRVRAWSDALRSNDVVAGSTPETFEAEFIANAKRLETYVARFLEAGSAAAD